MSLCAAFFYASWSLQELCLDCESVGDNDNVDCSAVQTGRICSFDKIDPLHLNLCACAMDWHM